MTDEDRRWRVSMSGCSIKEGDAGRIVASYPGKVAPLDRGRFERWLEDAEGIVERHNAGRSRLTCDDDGHWYVLPADKAPEADRYFEAVHAYRHDPHATGDEPAMPGWLVRLPGGPTSLTFQGWEVS